MMLTQINQSQWKKTISISSALFASLLMLPFAHGQATPTQKPPEKREAPPAMKEEEAGRPRHEPPPQAFDACKGLKEGAQVQVITPREGKIAATCAASPKGLFARPERPPHPPAQHRGDEPPAKRSEPSKQ